MLVVVIQSRPKRSAAAASRTHHAMKPCGYNAVISEDHHRLTPAASSALWKSVIFLKVFLKRCYLGFHPGVTQFREDSEEASVALLLAALYKRLVFASLHTPCLECPTRHTTGVLPPATAQRSHAGLLCAVSGPSSSIIFPPESPRSPFPGIVCVFLALFHSPCFFFPSL